MSIDYEIDLAFLDNQFVESEADLTYEDRIELYGDEGNDELPDIEPIDK